MEIFVALIVVMGAMLLCLNTLASLAIKYDHSLQPFQKITQFIIAWIIPFIGAGIVLRIVFEHSPDTIPRKWVPWPFKNLIYGKPVKPNRNRDGGEHGYGSNGPSGWGGDGSSGGGGD